MKPTTKNRWLKLIAWLLVVVIIVMLLIPKELTESQFAQIQPGMTIADVTRLLGSPDPNRGSFAVTTGWHGRRYDRQWGMPTLSARFPDDADMIELVTSTSSNWIGKTHVFWVEYKDGAVNRTWMLPLARSGGGLQGFINTIKQYWNNWRK